jgi:uncharacterized protein involved in exopolysaccharide biosynthesis
MHVSSSSTLSIEIAGPWTSVSQLEPLRRETPSHLREYIGIVWLRKWWVLGVASLVVGGAITYAVHETAVYSSQAKVLVEAVSLSTTQAGQQPPPNIDTEEQLVDSAAVASVVIRELKLTDAADEVLKHLSVSSPTNTEILLIS